MDVSETTEEPCGMAIVVREAAADIVDDTGCEVSGELAALFENEELAALLEDEELSMLFEDERLAAVDCAKELFVTAEPVVKTFTFEPLSVPQPESRNAAAHINITYLRFILTSPQ